MNNRSSRITLSSAIFCAGMALALTLLSRGAHAAEPVRIYDTHGSADSAQWTRVTGTPEKLDPKNTVIENGIIRLTYPCDFGGPVKKEQMGGWLLFLRLGERYELAQSKIYGDWLYVGSSIDTDPTGFRIVRNDEERVVAEMDFDNHACKNLKPPVPCKLRKTLTLAAGHYGYVVHVALERNDLTGEKETGFGESLRHRFFYNPVGGHMRPDNTTVSVYPRKEGQVGQWWSAGLPTDDSFYRLLAVRPAYRGAIRTVQWNTRTYGFFYQWTYAPCAAYETYIAVVPYDGRQAAQITVRDGAAIVQVPRDGNYTIFSRGADALYAVAIRDVPLKAGENSVNLDGQPLEQPIVAPVSNGRDFPEDICKQYHGLFTEVVPTGGN